MLAIAIAGEGVFPKLAGERAGSIGLADLGPAPDVFHRVARVLSNQVGHNFEERFAGLSVPEIQIGHVSIPPFSVQLRFFHQFGESFKITRFSIVVTISARGPRRWATACSCAESSEPRTWRIAPASDMQSSPRRNRPGQSRPNWTAPVSTRPPLG